MMAVNLSVYCSLCTVLFCLDTIFCGLLKISDSLFSIQFGLFSVFHCLYV